MIQKTSCGKIFFYPGGKNMAYPGGVIRVKIRQRGGKIRQRGGILFYMENIITLPPGYKIGKNAFYPLEMANEGSKIEQ